MKEGIIVIKNLNNKGFGAGVLIVFIAFIGIGFAGWMVWHRSHKRLAAPSASTSHQAQSHTNSPGAAAAQTGWKTYCDAGAGSCFQYPATWTADLDTSQGTSLTLHSPANTVIIDYTAPFTKDSGLDDFYVSALGTTTAAPDSGLEVVSGIYTPTNTPQISLVDASLPQTSPLIIGQTDSFPIAPRFTSKSGAQAQLAASPVQAMATITQAKAWFTSSEAQTALQIIRSYH